MALSMDQLWLILTHRAGVQLFRPVITKDPQRNNSVHKAEFQKAMQKT